ncbi:MAG: zinc dependent phospholipase C family protein [Tissierellia bacterium]|nr:zinc dependent phospholipase C family protein [Tissierellia bacterium]
MFTIITETHKLIAGHIHSHLEDRYGINLDKKQFLKGSIAPDVEPQYKLNRHYIDYSLNFVVAKIVKLIYLNKLLNQSPRQTFQSKYMSKELGVISHYLCDFVTQPHNERNKFKRLFKSHLKYEYILHQVALHHDFEKDIINIPDMNIMEFDGMSLAKGIARYINSVVDEYTQKESFKNDLNYAMSLNVKVMEFVVETVFLYADEVSYSISY